jgi:Na+/phosphate symporter
MTAMGASFADRAWGRESAVYRISGVLNVIGGWFFTAFAAFTGAFLIATAIFYGGLWVTIIFIVLALLTIIRTHAFHHRRAEKRAENERFNAIESYSAADMKNQCMKTLTDTLTRINIMYGQTLKALFSEKRKKLNELRKESKEVRSHTQELKQHLADILKKLAPEAIPTSHNYVQIVENLNELAYTFNFITKYSFEHVDNNHKEFNNEQIKELTELINLKNNLTTHLVENLEVVDDVFVDEMQQRYRNLIHYMDQCVLRQIKRVKAGVSGKRNSMLFMNIISETKNLISFELNMLRAYRQFLGQMPRGGGGI